MNLITGAAIAGIGLTSLVVVTYYTRRLLSDKKLKNTESEVRRRIEKSKKDSEKIIERADFEYNNILKKGRREAEGFLKEHQRTAHELEKRVLNKEKQLLEKEDNIEQERQKFQSLQQKQKELIKKLSLELEKVAGLTKEEAEKLLMDNVERDSRQRAGKMIKDMEEKTKKIAQRRAREIVTDAIQRTAVDHVSSITTTTLQLPDMDMKGRVIGKEGRNIRTFEALSGVDVIIDDTPGTVILSAFDPIRREVARMTMKKLLEDGRIQPARIEEEIEKSRSELKEIIIEHGEKAADELGLEFHPKIIELMGKLHYRSSYGQNILYHSLEAAHIAGIMAAQLGVNVTLAKRGAMMHDIGKALDFEREGSHTHLGREVCEQYGESPEIINCIMAHHEEEPPETVEAILVMVADAMSSVRPGARRESVDAYVKRLEKLETISKAFEGVDNAYAIQAGREIRVIVNPEDVNDDATHKLALDIAQKIEKEVDYPGEVKVNIVRETRAIGIAK
ncbi:ribonuclease Y [Candidatus Marinamargulisbacteria bacterium SCGC AG-414-C22]|nr:ribonuclease Y [Candidatus Marinamargulisbacteria bacterium SCGC AG-414-C22]